MLAQIEKRLRVTVRLEYTLRNEEHVAPVNRDKTKSLLKDFLADGTAIEWASVQREKLVRSADEDESENALKTLARRWRKRLHRREFLFI